MFAVLIATTGFVLVAVAGDRTDSGHSTHFRTTAVTHREPPQENGAHEQAAPHYDFPKLLKYPGPSYRLDAPPPAAVSLLDFRNSDRNERNIAILLSSQSIPFHIDRPQAGWSQPKLRMIVMVPPESAGRAQALLMAAAEQSLVDVVEGIQGLPGIPDDTR